MLEIEEEFKPLIEILRTFSQQVGWEECEMNREKYLTDNNNKISDFVAFVCSSTTIKHELS